MACGGIFGSNEKLKWNVPKGGTMNHLRAPLCLMIAAGVLAACGSANTSTSPSSGQSSPASYGKTTSSSSTGLATSRSSGYGVILTSPAGQTYYMFTADSRGKSACYGACAAIWKPVLGPVGSLPKTLKRSLAGSIVRTNGQVQLTYHGHPLYTFTSDSQTHLVSGEGIDAFGGYWYVLNAKGNPITAAIGSKSSGGY